MRLAMASALINTTWQRLIRVAWVPSNQPVVAKPPSLVPAFPQSGAGYCPNLTNRHLSLDSGEGFIHCLLTSRSYSKGWSGCAACWKSFFLYLASPHRWWKGRGHCCKCCWFRCKEKRKNITWITATDLCLSYQWHFRKRNNDLICNLRPDGLLGQTTL